jgi:hypothetical protein
LPDTVVAFSSYASDQVVFISNLWGNKELTFYGNDYLTPLTVRHDFATFLNHPQGAMTLLQEEQFQVKSATAAFWFLLATRLFTSTPLRSLQATCTWHDCLSRVHGLTK